MGGGEDNGGGTLITINNQLAPSLSSATPPRPHKNTFLYKIGFCIVKYSILKTSQVWGKAVYTRCGIVQT